MNYVLVTAARNEEAVIAQTIESVTSQTKPPLRWVIVDDGSTDRTAEIAADFARQHQWIKLVRRPPRALRSFAGKAESVHLGLESMKDLSFEVFGNLDADVSFDPDYMDFVVQKIADDPSLGIAGTPFTQAGGYDSARDSYEGENYVAGPCQLFRYQCFRDIGGYKPNPAGGVDWIAVMTARMNGWKVKAFPQKRFHHHRPMGTAERGALAALFSYGEKDYYLGGSPIWQLVRGVFRMTKSPLVFGGGALLAGYAWAAVRRTQRAVSPELMRFHRKEQMKKLKTVLRTVLRLKRPNLFLLAGEGQSE
jgi:glycosyltransferase involved in cell wall biosynthesis